MSKGSVFFRNLHLFRLPAPWRITADELEQHLATVRFNPCGNQDMESRGFASPRAKTKEAPLVHSTNGQFLIAVCEQKKILPNAVVQELAEERAEEIEEREARRVGRKEMREIRERMVDELLPRALSTKKLVLAWIDPVNGWMAVNAGSPARAEAVLELLRKAIKELPASLLKTVISPTSAMTAWLSSGEAPKGFTIDQDCEMKSAESAAVRYVHHALDGEDVCQHITAGKVATRLALTWNDRISFELTAQLEIKHLSFLDILKDEADGQAENDDERFDIEFTLMTGELARLLDDLVLALGGKTEVGAGDESSSPAASEK